MAQNYTLHFANNSVNSGSMLVFQKNPNANLRNILSLAWFTKFMYPQTTGRFNWTNTFTFQWAETGVLKPGILFQASQSVNANLTTSNSINLAYDRAFYFADEGASDPLGCLVIKNDSSVAFNKASVGIGMSGESVFSIQAQPNFEIILTPHHTYWIAFGEYTQGEVLDIESITNCAQIQFPQDVYSMNAVLNADNTWTIKEF